MRFMSYIKMVRRRSIWLLSALLLMLSSVSDPTRAAVLIEQRCEANTKPECPHRGEIKAIYIYGKINMATAIEIARVDAALPAGKPFLVVHINSAGASFEAAAWIGRVQRRRQESIEARDALFPLSDTKCYTACVFVALGAVNRQLTDVGLHHGYGVIRKKNEIVDVKPVSQELEEEMFAYLDGMGVHPELHRVIERTPPEKITYFTYDPDKPDEEQPIVLISLHMRPDDALRASGLPAQAFTYNSKEEQLLLRAARGDIIAAEELANAYLFGGTEIKRDSAAGLRFLEQVADSGDLDARHHLALILSNGWATVPIDKKSAVYHYNIAAQAGSAASQNNLGFTYFTGDGVEPNFALAVYWLTRSAEQGEPFAYGSLGEIYSAGGVFPKDDIETFKWLKLAVMGMPAGKSRDEDARLLEGVTKRMSAEQIEEAERRVSAWKPLLQTRRTMRDKGD